MSEGKSSKGCIVAVVWLVILVILGVAVWFFYTKSRRNSAKERRNSSRATLDQTVATLMKCEFRPTCSAVMRFCVPRR